MAKKAKKEDKTEQFLAEFKTDNQAEMAQNLVARLREISDEKKKLEDEAKVHKHWLREYGKSLRKDDEERSINVGSGATIAFQTDVAKDLSDDDAKKLREQFTLFFEGEGEKMFKSLFERKVTWKPIAGFGETFKSFEPKIRKKIKAILSYKANTPLVQL